MTKIGRSPNLNIPNALTVFRIVLVPWLLRALIERSHGVAIGVFAIAGITDGLDGYIAKRFNMKTYLGSVLDPIADKVLVVACTAVLGAQGALPVWLAVVVIGRDMLVFLGAITYRILAGTLEMSPTVLGKINTFVQLLLLLTILCREAGALWAGKVSPFLVVAALIAAVFSGFHYVVVWSRKAYNLNAGKHAGQENV